MTENQPRSKEQILHTIKTRGPQTAADLADRLSITPMAVRQHLSALEADGLVNSEPKPNGVGRPKLHWRLSESAAKRFPDTHAELAVGMIDSIRSAFGESGLQAVLKERTNRQKAAYSAALAAANTIGDRTKALAKLRSDEGYMAAWVEDGDGYLLIENHCPICAAAAACTGICDGELDLFQSLLGADVRVTRTEHIVSGSRCCTYEIRPREPQSMTL